jgi:hypothetical protein
VDVYTVQECGCIALPEDIQEQTGLSAGATFRMEASADGATLMIHVVHRTALSEPPAGAACQT